MNTKKVIPRLFDPAFKRGLVSATGVVISLVLLLYGQAASAAESASFQLYDSFPNVSGPGPDQSHSFLLNENGVTWVAQPGLSQHFQIVAGAAASYSSSSSVMSRDPVSRHGA